MTEWNVSGEYVETCNCSVPCQCLWSEPPDDGTCTAAVFWNITEGAYGDVALDGLTAGLLVREDGVLLEGGWDVVLVLDEAADEEQTAALEDIFLGRAGGLMGAVAGLIDSVEDVVSLPITYSSADDHFSFEAGDAVSMAADGSYGFGEELGSVSPHPFLPPSMESDLGKSTEATVSFDETFAWDVPENNAYFGDFAFGNA